MSLQPLCSRIAPTAARQSSIRRPLARRGVLAWFGWSRSIMGVLPVLLAITSGCQNSPYALRQQMAWQQQQMTAAQQEQTSVARAANLDRDNAELQTLLSQREQENRVLQEEVLGLKDQLTSTLDQLAGMREQMQGLEEQSRVLSAAARRRAGATITANSTLGSRLSELHIVGFETRMDGDVARIEVPAAELFDAQTGQLLPAAASLLETVSQEINRVFPQHLLGIEGHTSSEPGMAPSASLQQMTVAQAMAVHDFLVSKNLFRPDQLMVVGHSANHPVVSNATDRGRVRNRRVELVIYPEKLTGQ